MWSGSALAPARSTAAARRDQSGNLEKLARQEAADRPESHAVFSDFSGKEQPEAEFNGPAGELGFAESSDQIEEHDLLWGFRRDQQVK